MLSLVETVSVLAWPLPSADGVALARHCPGHLCLASARFEGVEAWRLSEKTRDALLAAHDDPV